jgi:hypothetical protein
MRYLWWAVLAGCSPPELSTAQDVLLFEGGDGLSPSLDRVLSGTITSDTTLDASEPWILDGLVFVGEGATLTIEPGTTIYGNPSTRGTLVVSQGGRIVADGTAAQPIVFTSPRARGARRAGDWGGIAINGEAPVNGCPSQPCVIEGEGETGPYGGSDEDDDSGVMRYVRIEFAGALYTPEDELNGLALQGVGRGTVLDHLHLHTIADDGIEFFGGTANVRHVLVTGAGDDSFDWTGGWQGTAQYVITQQHPGSGDCGIEADNNEDDHAADPQSLPVISNLTAVGTSTTTGFVFRRGTGVRLSNSIVYAYATCVDVRDDLTWESTPRVAGSWLFCGSPYGESTYTDGTGTHTVQSLIEENPGNMLGDPGLVNPTDPHSPDFRLQPSSLALSGAVEPFDPALEVTSFVGAMDDENDWTVGWTTAGTN